MTAIYRAKNRNDGVELVYINNNTKGIKHPADLQTVMDNAQIRARFSLLLCGFTLFNNHTGELVMLAASAPAKNADDWKSLLAACRKLLGQEPKIIFVESRMID